MSKENIIILSDNIMISEDDRGNLLLDFILCDFNVNSNGKKINREGAEDKIQSLVGMPLVAKLKTVNGETDFTSHQRKTKYVQENGKLKTVTYLDTDAFGSFKSVDIKEIDGVEYITAQAILWGRFEKAKQVVLDRLANNEVINSSWELVPTDVSEIYEDGEKIGLLNDYYFIGHCLLGKNVRPAYACSMINEVQVAEEEDNFETELSDAIALDINNLKNEGGEGMAENEKIEGNEVETSASLTMNDLRKKVCKLAYEIEREEDFWLDDYDSVHYPLDNTVYFRKRSQDTLDSDYLKVVYSVDEEGNITLVSKENVEMTFVPKATVVEVSELETVKNKLAEKETELSTKETELSEKIESIVTLGQTISTQEAELSAKDTVISERDKTIAELEVFKVQISEIETKKAEKELAEKREACKGVAISSGYITEADIEASEDLQNAIFSCDEAKVKVFIAEAVIKEASEKAKKKKEAEVSEVGNKNEEKEVEISTDLGATDSYEYKGDTGNSLYDFLKKKKK